MSTPPSIIDHVSAAERGAGLAAFLKQIWSSKPMPLDALPVPVSLLPDYFVLPSDQEEPAPEKILAQLINSPHADVRLAVAHYPYTPMSCLLRLTESKDLETRRAAVARLLKEYAAPMTLQALAASPYEDIQLAVLKHPLLPQSNLIALAGKSASQPTRTAALHCLWQRPLTSQVFEEIAVSPYPDVLIKLIQQPAVPGSILVALARDNQQVQVRQGALDRLRQVELTPEMLAQLATSRFEDVLLFVCQQPHTPVTVLVDLAAGNSSQAIRAQALQQVATADASAATLTRLVNSPYQDVVQIVINHAQVATSTLLQLACHHSVESIRQLALQRITQRGLEASVLSALADSIYSDVLEVVARHPATPAACYEQVARNLGARLSHDYVRTEYRSEQEWVEDTEYDAYGSYYSSGGHYEERQVSVQVIDYERINQLLAAMPLELRRLLRAPSGSLQSDNQVKWAV